MVESLCSLSLSMVTILFRGKFVAHQPLTIMAAAPDSNNEYYLWLHYQTWNIHVTFNFRDFTEKSRLQDFRRYSTGWG